jgi:hypothetical protein
LAAHQEIPERFRRLSRQNAIASTEKAVVSGAKCGGIKAPSVRGARSDIRAYFSLPQSYLCDIQNEWRGLIRLTGLDPWSGGQLRQKQEAEFFIPIARNPLKCPNSKK